MNYLSLRCCDTFELGFIPIICYPIFLLFILIYMFPGYSCYSCNLCMLVVRIPIYCIPLFILVICYPAIPVTYSRYLLYNFYCCIFLIPIIEIFLLLTHVICIIHVYTHTLLQYIPLKKYFMYTRYWFLLYKMLQALIRSCPNILPL